MKYAGTATSAPNIAGEMRSTNRPVPWLGEPAPTTSAASAINWSKMVPNWLLAVPCGKKVHGSNGIVSGKLLMTYSVERM